jgi:ubiquinone/menaquinone biosynthesis C-methylase UbiE
VDRTTQGQVAEGAAEVYEEFFVPALFAQWTDRVLRLAGVAPGDHVLDVGCGTGVLARAAAERVGPEGRVCGLDPNEGMRAVARRRSSGVQVVEGVAESMPFEDDSFDQVLCQFALMFFTDRAAGLREMARVLRPGGHVVLLTWAALESSPGYAAMVDLLDRVIGPEAAQALLAPFSIGTPDALARLANPVFRDVEVERLDGQARFNSIEAWVHTDIKGWTLRDAISDAQYAELLGAANRELARFAGPDGGVSFAAPALVTRI